MLLALFVIYSAMSAVLWSVNPYRGTHSVLDWICFGAVFFFSLHTLNSYDRAYQLLQIEFSIAVVLSIHGVLQHFGILDTSPNHLGRSFSTLGNPTIYGGYLVLCIPTAISLALISSLSKKQHWYWIATPMLFMALFWSYSRGAMAAFAIALVVMCYPLYRILKGVVSIKPTKRGLIVLGLILPMIITLPFFDRAISWLETPQIEGAKRWQMASTDRYGSKEGFDSDIGMRASIWDGALKLWLEHPLRGLGIGSFGVCFLQVAPMHFQKIEGEGRGTPLQAHQLYLHILTETGAIGLFLFVGALGAIALPALHGLNKDGQGIQSKIVHWGLLTSLLAALIHSLVDTHLLLIPLGFLFWVHAGLLLQYSNGAHTVAHRSHALRRIWRHSRRYVLVLFCLTCILITTATSLGVMLLNLGSLTLVERQYDKAIFYLNVSHLLQPTYWVPIKKLAVAYEGRFESSHDIRDLERAQSYLQEAIRLNSNYAGIYESFGRFLIRHAENVGPQALQQARVMLLESLVKNRFYRGTYNKLGIIAQREGRLKEAEHRYRKAIEIDSVYIEAWNNLATLYVQSGNFNKAEKAYRRLVELEPDNPSYILRLGNVFFRQKRYDVARVVYEKILGDKTYRAKAYNNIGNIYYMLGEYKMALIYYRMALNFDPESSRASNNINKVHRLIQTKGLRTR